MEDVNTCVPTRMVVMTVPATVDFNLGRTDGPAKVNISVSCMF